MNRISKYVLAIAAAAMMTFCTPLLPGNFMKTEAQAQGTYSYQVKVDSGYLALRNAKAFSASNEIGKLYTGETVQVEEISDEQYWYVYAPSLNKSGYVDRNFLRPVDGDYSLYNTMTVKVQTGYLALRTAMAFDISNEIGKLFTGDVVEVISMDDAKYWYVYAPVLGKYGFVNSDYLEGDAPSLEGYEDMSVSVNSGYLALRNAKAFEQSNEIGKLNTGDVVSVIDKSDDEYWYVYAPTLQKYGFVNRNYLYGTVSSHSDGLYTYTVRVENDYLALRTAMANDPSNEIGKLYSGQPVQLIDTGDGTYWYVYSPTLGLYGYVNAMYLY